MSTQERLSQYEREMNELLARKQELIDALERIEYEIGWKQGEIDECEADLLNPEYSED